MIIWRLRSLRKKESEGADAARDLLDRAAGEVKTAVVMARFDISGDEARGRLREGGGSLRTAMGEGAS